MEWFAGLRRLRFERLVNALARRLWADPASAAPQLLDLPPGTRMLVLAPHPDDESIGCGGTLARWRRAGRAAKVLFLTDGRLGSRSLRAMAEHDPQRAEAERRLVETRREEAALAMQALAVDEFAFADAPDGELWRRVEPVAGLVARAIEESGADLIMLPFLTDRHPDHIAAGACLLGALRQMSSARLSGLTCAGYEVWSPILANAVVDITDSVEQKKAAIAVYRSQLQDTNYLDGAISLNRFRAISNLLPGTHAEAFYVAPAKTFMELIAA
ncbi:MAG TPA: PIG-L deacetylase family protein [Dongiaceae bacterium]|jgi:LmbE family N-acetylglucosaminyl deacetylase|nr:PIG-L deacetylase family protein [Dongiaceae bacterium]